MLQTKLLCTLLLFHLLTHAQKASTTIASAHIGYGSENNYGFTGIFGGAAYEKLHGPKLSTELAATYFADNSADEYTNGSEQYQALFFSARAGYHLIGNHTSRFRCRLAAGPAIRYAAARYFKGNNGNALSIRINPDGSQTIREPFSYGYEKTLTVMVQGSLDLTFRLGTKTELGLILETYNREILLEHFMPAFIIGRRF